MRTVPQLWAHPPPDPVNYQFNTQATPTGGFFVPPINPEGMAINAIRSQGQSLTPRKEPGAWIARLMLDDSSLALFRIGFGLIALLWSCRKRTPLKELFD
jgi:hypothetical protein